MDFSVVEVIGLCASVVGVCVDGDIGVNRLIVLLGLVALDVVKAHSCVIAAHNAEGYLTEPRVGLADTLGNLHTLVVVVVVADRNHLAVKINYRAGRIMVGGVVLNSKVEPFAKLRRGAEVLLVCGTAL